MYFIAYKKGPMNYFKATWSISALLVAGVLLTFPGTAWAQFTEVSTALEGVSNSETTWGDYDNDGDLDVLLTGYHYSGTFDLVARVYRNDGNDTFTDINAGLAGSAEGSAAWGDYDNDGDLDILLTGLVYSNIGSAAIYRNDGNDTFTDINAGFPALSYSSGTWGDYDNDGDLDILLTGIVGAVNANSISKIYRNDGNGVFTEINAGLDALYVSSAAWGDYDNDGDLDILISGYKYNFGTLSIVYRNDGNGSFTDINAGLTNARNSSTEWGDYDNDGDLDILLTGYSYETGPLVVIANIYRNDGNDTFTDINAGLTGVFASGAAWGDYDNDGDLDILLAGATVTSAPSSRLYRNDGSDAFTEVNTGLADVAAASVAWGDYDSDGDLDILITGGGNSGSVSKIYRNDLPPVRANTFTNVDIGLPGVYYPGMAWGDYDNDGDLDILFTGIGQTGSYAQVVRNDGNDTFTDINAGLPGVYVGSVAWGDYDNDGDLDILLTGSTFSAIVSRVYRNNGDDTFTDINAGLAPVWESSIAWGDYDNDGDLDILLVGDDETVTVSRIYRNDGSDTFTDISAALPQVKNGGVAWGDYDNDGDLDVLISGYSDPGFVSAVYRNNGDDTFTDINAGLIGVFLSGVAWGDYDNDGDLDILISGYSDPDFISAVYRNNGDDTFTDINAGLTGASFSNVEWGDYDNDGDLDILFTGFGELSGLSLIYRNNRDGTFTDINAGLEMVSLGDAAWGDYDKDGDLDVMLTGQDANSQPVFRLYRNERNQPPTADADGPYTVECRNAADGSTTVLLDGTASSDPDGDALTYLWTTSEPGAAFDDATLSMPTLILTAVAPGTVFDLTLTVNDGLATGETTTTVSVVDTTPPVIRCPAMRAMEPVGPAGNVVDYAPEAFDACEGALTVICDPPSGSTFAVGTTTVVICTATDSSGNEAQCSITVQILSVQETLNKLQETITRLQNARSIRKAVARVLSNRLRSTQKHLRKGNTKNACKELQKFIKKVQDEVKHRRLPADKGDALIQSAVNLRATLGC